jgi:hypothetical protein
MWWSNFAILEGKSWHDPRRLSSRPLGKPISWIDEAFVRRIMQKEIDFPPNPIEKPGYHLVFQDEFNGTRLNTNNWLPCYLPQWSSRHLTEARFRLANSTLQLLIDEDQQPWCPDHDGAVRVSSLQTGCYSGPLGSSIGQHRFNQNLTVSETQSTVKLFIPKYGYFETRLKALPISGYMAALWMIGFEESPEESAEICICEIFGVQVAGGTSTVGYGLHPFNDPDIYDAFFQDSFEFDASNYHIYAAEWTPTHVDFNIDNEKVRTIDQSPNYPMQLMLGIYEIPDQLNEQSEGDTWPKVLEVDYVRGYFPIAGYEK